MTLKISTSRWAKKSYELMLLASQGDELTHRLEQISSFTSKSLAPVEFEFKDERLLRKQKWVKGCAPTPGRLTPEQALDFAYQLDTIHAIGLVHGDLHPRNVLTVDNRIVLLDWEPSLKQILGGKLKWLVTPGWQAPQDVRTCSLTHLTDQWVFARWLTQEPISATALMTKVQQAAGCRSSSISCLQILKTHLNSGLS